MRINLPASVTAICLLALVGCDNHSSNKAAAKSDKPDLAAFMMQVQKNSASPTPAISPVAPAAALALAAVPSAPLPTANTATPGSAFL